MSEAREGQVVTFYSFKGGTGRTMALANVAWILAANGKRVLVADWDLESPGLHRFYHPFMRSEAVRDTPGVIDLIREFDNEAKHRAAQGRAFDDIADYARVERYAMSLDWKFPGAGTLDFLSAGRQNGNYTAAVSSLDWDTFYDRLGGGELFDALRADMKRHYDYTLIDSRTGFSDVADICTVHLPDTLVDCFTLSTQGIEGAAEIARSVAKYRRAEGAPGIRVLPVPMRVENAEQAKADAGRALVRARFAELPAGLDAARRAAYWDEVEIPYRPFYAYEETLAVFGDDSAGPLTLLGAFQRLTGHLTGGEVGELPAMDPRERGRGRALFERRSPVEVERITLDYEPEDQVWAEWVERVLTEAGVSVHDPHGPDPLSPEGSARVLAIVSPAYREARGPGADPRAADGRARYAVYVTDMPQLERFPSAASARLAGLSAPEAAGRLTALVGSGPVPGPAMRALGARYPVNEPRVDNIPARNVRFTGRGEDLRALRAALRSSSTAVALLALQGLGGVGKTQLAIEYAHRFRSEYDLVWWIQCGQPQFTDAALVDLAKRLTSQLGAQLGVDSGVVGTEIAQNTVRALGRGEPVRRWLLVFDNADDPAAVRDFLPSGAGGGHVLVTSRDRRWNDLARALDIDTFKRAESVAHLRQRVGEENITPAEADAVAAALGDLPLAVATGGAWLWHTNTTVPEYLRRLEEGGSALSDSPPTDYPLSVAATWNLSLDQVRERSAAAYRLLELCSVLSPDGISLDLVYSVPMVQALSRLDDTLSETGDVARLVQQINRFALIKLDTKARQLQIHRLLQEVVRQRMSPEERDTTRHAVHLLLAAWRPAGEVDDPPTWDGYRMLWPHLDPSGAVESRDERVRGLFIDRVRYMYIRGDLAGGEATVAQTQAAWLRTLEQDPGGPGAGVLRRQLLHLRFNLGNILRSQARYREAWELDGEVLAQQVDLLGEANRHSLMTAGSLAADLRALGRYGEALEGSRTAYDTWVAEYGEDYPRTLDAATNLAVSYRLTGGFAQALALDEATYDRRQAVMSRYHPRTFASANAIGRDLREAGRYQESVEWLKAQLASSEQELEPNARVTLQIQVNLGVSLRAVGGFAEAEPLLQAALGRLEATYGAQDADTLACRVSLAGTRLEGGDAAGAVRELRAVSASWREGLGPEHPTTLVCASDLVAALRALPAPQEALALGRETAQLTERVLGPGHPYTLAASVNLAVCLADAGYPEESRALDARTVALMVAGLPGADHPDTLCARAHLALGRREAGEPGAREEFARIVEDLVRLLGPAHPGVAALQAGRRIHRLLDAQPA
jgi:tetratricopeptide (TPR) repeat protein